jgi:hypothetical protein
MPLPAYIHWLPIAIGLCMIVASIAVGFSAWRRCSAIRSSRSWPAIEAEVTCTDIESHDNVNTETTAYLPKVWYRYQVDTKSYEGQFDLISSVNRDVAERARAPYQKGRSLVVRYDPKNPQRAVVEGQPVRARDIGLLIAATLTCLIGLGVLASILFDR